ncbi:hypothetical protein COCON_G00186840 [Conger conger]|uniref:Ig-like domain-containing protein n=1 Tax=Conger conger TaxID=82655 RepID=A0A9Q1HRX1_CONCO|nr:hypothetical protein COCON_G00186840 [Conger conger]
MDSAVWTVLIFCVSSLGCSRGCVRTDPAHRVQEGADVRLACTFSTCPGPLDHTVHVSWEFNDTDFVFFYYKNQSVGKWRNTEWVGDILTGDFSVILRSVTEQHTGTYTCSVRPLNSLVIYKNHTLLTVARNRSGRRFMVNSAPVVSSLLWLILGSCAAGLGLLAAGCILGVGVYWRRGQDQQKNHGIPAPTEDTQRPHKNKDTDCYVTLQRGQAPPPVPKEESIYITMHGRPVPPAMQSQQGHSRKAIPTVWYAQENPPHIQKGNPPFLCPISGAASAL